MGGDGWSQTGPYQQVLAAAFRQAQEQEQELARDRHGFDGLTVDGLWEDEEWREYIMTGGTGTVLDQIRVVDAAHSEWGPFMRPLTEVEVRAWCPGGRPTEAEWLDALKAERLEYPERACGNCTVLYHEGQPAQIGYWGVTADCRGDQRRPASPPRLPPDRCPAPPGRPRRRRPRHARTACN